MPVLLEQPELNKGPGRPRLDRPPVPESCEVRTDFVTTGYLMRLFGRAEPTLYLWRRERGLPYVLIPGDDRAVVRYDLRKVLAWAKENRIRIRVVEEPNVVVNE